MIVADTSALIAIVFDEPDRDAMAEAFQSAATVLISTATAVEARMVVHARKGQAGVIALDELMSLPGVELVPPSAEEASIAYRAFVAFGRGSGHPANLNFGDLFSYALANSRRLPLLYKGQDFSVTDIPSVLNAARAR